MIFFSHSHNGAYTGAASGASGRNPVILHQPTAEPTLSPVLHDELWWVGAGIYSQQKDGLWKHQTMRFSGVWQKTFYFGTWLDASLKVTTLIHTEWEIDKAIRSIGLEPASNYVRIEKWQCEALERIAERWCIFYCWSERLQQRHFRKALPYYLFTWSYGEK